MSYFFYPPDVSNSSGVPTYPTLGAFPPASTAGNGALAIALDTNILYESNGTTWIPIAGPGVALSVGTFDSGTPSANGAHIDANALIMQSASAVNPGLVNISTQTFAGNKTFNGTIAAANLIGQNSGDTNIVFRPGGTQGGLVYNNWPDLYAAIVILDIALVDVCFDNSIQPIVIPAGTYNLINVRFEAALGTSLTSPITITLADGCVFTNFPGITNLITLESNSTTPVFIPPNPAYLLALQFTGTLTSNTAAPMIQVPPGFTLFLILLANSSVSGQPGFPLIELQGNAALFVLLAEATSFGDNVVSGGPTASLQIIVENPNVNLSTNQSDYTGSTAIGYPAQATNMTFGNSLGDLIYADTSGRGTILSADTTNTKKFLSEQSIASNPQAPIWDILSSADMPAFTGDVTTSAGSTVTTVAKIQGTTVSGTTGIVNVVFSNSPTLVTPVLGAASATSLSISGQLTSTIATGTAPFVVTSTTQVANLNVATAGNVTGIVDVTHGGTNLTSGTSGGILGFTGTTTLASSPLLTANQLIKGGGAGVTPSTLTAGSQFQVLVMGATIPGYGQVNLAQSAAITGTLPIGNGGTGVTSVTNQPTASAWAGWDASSQLYGAKFIVGLGDATATPTAGTYRGPNKTGSNVTGVDTTFDAGNGTGTGGSGALIFRTAATGGTSTLTEASRITPAGRTLLGAVSENTNGGVLQISAGITFPASQITSTDVNTLDDYEEGDWAPVIVGSTGAPNTPQPNGKYVKIGRVVYLQGGILFNKGSLTGNISGQNLPFTAAPVTTFGMTSSWWALTTAIFNHTLVPQNSATTFLMNIVASAAATYGNTNRQLTAADLLTNDNFFQWSGFYYIA